MPQLLLEAFRLIGAWILAPRTRRAGLGQALAWPIPIPIPSAAYKMQIVPAYIWISLYNMRMIYYMVWFFISQIWKSSQTAEFKLCYSVYRIQTRACDIIIYGSGLFIECTPMLMNCWLHSTHTDMLLDWMISYTQSIDWPCFCWMLELIYWLFLKKIGLIY